jgi:hypothetical protein
MVYRRKLIKKGGGDIPKFRNIICKNNESPDEVEFESVGCPNNYPIRVMDESGRPKFGELHQCLDDKQQVITACSDLTEGTIVDKIPGSKCPENTVEVYTCKTKRLFMPTESSLYNTQLGSSRRRRRNTNTKKSKKSSKKTKKNHRRKRH